MVRMHRNEIINWSIATNPKNLLLIFVGSALAGLTELLEGTDSKYTM